MRISRLLYDFTVVLDSYKNRFPPTLHYLTASHCSPRRRQKRSFLRQPVLSSRMKEELDRIHQNRTIIAQKKRQANRKIVNLPRRKRKLYNPFGVPPSFQRARVSDCPRLRPYPWFRTFKIEKIPCLNPSSSPPSCHLRFSSTNPP